MVLKFAYFVYLSKGYQPEKIQCCKLSGTNFYRGITKHNDDIIMMSLHILEFGISIFCETAYMLSSCQVSNSSVI